MTTEITKPPQNSLAASGVTGTGIEFDGAFGADDLVIGACVLYQGTNEERQRPWYRSGLEPGSVLDPVTGTVVNDLRFAILKVSKHFVLFPPRGTDGDNQPIINTTSPAEVMNLCTAEYLAEAGWAPGESYDPKEGTYHPAQLQSPMQWVEMGPDENFPPLVESSFDFLAIFEDGTLATVRMKSRRDGDIACKKVFTACVHASRSPIPWAFRAGSQERESKANGKTWLGMQVTKSGLVDNDDFKTIVKTFQEAIASGKTTVRVDGDTDTEGDDIPV